MPSLYRLRHQHCLFRVRIIALWVWAWDWTMTDTWINLCITRRRSSSRELDRCFYFKICREKLTEISSSHIEVRKWSLWRTFLCKSIWHKVWGEVLLAEKILCSVNQICAFGRWSDFQISEEKKTFVRLFIWMLQKCILHVDFVFVPFSSLSHILSHKNTQTDTLSPFFMLVFCLPS